MEFDLFGRRIRKTVDGQETEFVYNGFSVLAEYDGTGSLIRKYVYGPGIDLPVAMVDCDGGGECWYYYHQDHCPLRKEYVPNCLTPDVPLILFHHNRRRHCRLGM